MVLLIIPQQVPSSSPEIWTDVRPVFLIIDQKAGKYETIEITGVEPVEFDNIPTAGFVLNKKAGGTSSGWDHRQTYCRVYDPRGWEFEITIPNLLFLLEECSSFKGKGLEGEFVYSWEGKDLVLLPVSSYDYKLGQRFTELQSKKIGKKDLVEGCSYITSKQETLLYLGQYDVSESYYSNNTEIEYAYWRNLGHSINNTNFTKRHVFQNMTNNTVFDSEPEVKYSYEFLKSFSTLKEKVSDTIDPNFAKYVEEFQKTHFYSKASSLVVELLTDEEWEESHICKYNHSATLYKMGQISTPEDLLLSKVTVNPERLNDAHNRPYGDFTGAYRVTRLSEKLSLWRDRRETIVATGLSLEDLKSGYGNLYRVYQSGFKEQISL